MSDDAKRIEIAAVDDAYAEGVRRIFSVLNSGILIVQERQISLDRAKSGLEALRKTREDMLIIIGATGNQNGKPSSG